MSRRLFNRIQDESTVHIGITFLPRTDTAAVNAERLGAHPPSVAVEAKLTPYFVQSFTVYCVVVCSLSCSYDIIPTLVIHRCLLVLFFHPFLSIFSNIHRCWNELLSFYWCISLLVPTQQATLSIISCQVSNTVFFFVILVTCWVGNFPFVVELSCQPLFIKIVVVFQRRRRWRRRSSPVG